MKKHNRHQRGFTAVETVLVLVIVAAIGFIGWYVYHAKKTTDKNYSAATSASQTTPIGSLGNAQSTGLSSGTDNQSLQTDLNSVNSSQNQAGQDASSANSAVNDSQSEVSVPTN